MWLTSSLAKVKNHLPEPVGGIPSNTAQDGAGCLCHKGTLAADVQLGDPQFFSALSQPSACSRECSYCTSGAGLGTSLCWTSWDLLSANFSGLSRSLCTTAQPSAVSNTSQQCHLHSNETRQSHVPVLNTTMWLSLLMTQTLWGEQHQPSCHKLWAREIISQLNNMDTFLFSYSYNFSCHRALWGHLCPR